MSCEEEAEFCVLTSCCLIPLSLFQLKELWTDVLPVVGIGWGGGARKLKLICQLANLFPAAVVHFGSEKHSDHYLRPDLLESAVSPSEADLLVARWKEMKGMQYQSTERYHLAEGQQLQVHHFLSVS
ncbi:hypothetical protein lerEdw1_017725 [Lerista edwardsae]|nr:hypothetical protein lerEdw1_017725 [Lerista edwardsae]